MIRFIHINVILKLNIRRKKSNLKNCIFCLKSFPQFENRAGWPGSGFCVRKAELAGRKHLRQPKVLEPQGGKSGGRGWEDKALTFPRAGLR